MGGSSDKRGGDSLEEETQSKKIGRPDNSHSHPRFQFPTPNWGDHPSNLMNLALQKYNQDWAQLVKDKPNTYAWVQFAFVGGLNVSSFINDGVWCHINFKAKKVDVIDDLVEDHGPYLFFAELKRPHLKPEYEVQSVYDLGSAKYVHRGNLGGCKACDRAQHRGLMMHPLNKGFNIGHTRQYEGANVIHTGQGQDLVSAYSAVMREKEAICALMDDLDSVNPNVVYGELSDKLAQLSLEYYNEAARNNQEPEYIFIKSKCCCRFTSSCLMMRWFHLNFIACTESKVEELIFFAEVNFLGITKAPEVVHCEVLGPASHVAPRLDGCIACDMTSCRSDIVHPINGVNNRAKFLAH